MKTNLKWVPLILLLVATSVMAQPADDADESAFWVVEGNSKRPGYTIIRFYNAQLLLLKEERISRKFLDIRKKKNQRLLNMKLKEVLYPQAMANRKKLKD